MTESSKGLHENNLSAGVVDRHRAIVSVMEELEAADWYAQRAEAATDDELRAILEHNGNEEKEHASMLLEWLRRKDSALAGHLDTYLYHRGSIIEAEAQQEAEGLGATSTGKSTSDGSLGIGSLKSNKS
ncbi:MAG TPA: ferritin [Polyangiaceae bacterium]|jgi:ferritin-like protein|nr:ferritin [Polyangiaceae bacterium]